MRCSSRVGDGGGPLGDALGGGLRRRHQHGLRARQQLGQTDRDVAGARRHVDQQVVELAPVHVGEELLERLVQHRAAPHDGAVLLHEEADRDALHVVRDGRHDHAVDGHRPLLDAQHARDGEAVDVGVDDADLVALVAQREREVDGQRRLADAALAGGDGDDAGARVDGDRLAASAARCRAVAAQHPGQLGALLGRHVREAHRDRAHAVQRADLAAHVALDLRLQRAARHASGRRRPRRRRRA